MPEANNISNMAISVRGQFNSISIQFFISPLDIYKVGGYSWPKIIQITDKSCIMIVYTRCWSQDIKENIWNAISLISHSMYKATYF